MVLLVLFLRFSLAPLALFLRFLFALLELFLRFLALRFGWRSGLTRMILEAGSALEHLCVGSGSAKRETHCKDYTFHLPISSLEMESASATCMPRIRMQMRVAIR